MPSRLTFFLFIALLCHFALPNIQAQTKAGGKTAVGRWKTIDDETQKERSIVEVFQQNGKYFAKVEQIFLEPDEKDKPLKCTKCSNSDPRFNQDIVGMVFLRNMEDRSSKYAGGDILDPKKGSVYTCTMWLDGPDKLMVRGWAGGIFYRTQTWYRVK